MQKKKIIQSKGPAAGPLQACRHGCLEGSIYGHHCERSRNGEREGLGPVRANTSLRSLNISYRKNGAPGTFWRGRYNLIRAPGNWLRLVLGGTGAPCSGVGSPVRGHCDGSVTLNGQGSHGGGEET